MHKMIAQLIQSWCLSKVKVSIPKKLYIHVAAVTLNHHVVQIHSSHTDKYCCLFLPNFGMFSNLVTVNLTSIVVFTLSS